MRVQTSGTAMLYQGNAPLHQKTMGDPLKHLRRKENALTVRSRFLSAQKSAIPDQVIKRNNINMLSHRFSVAPMMDWAGTSQKAKRDQHLSTCVASHAVPNAVPSNGRFLFSEQNSALGGVRRPQRAVVVSAKLSGHLAVNFTI
jgi:hypothetical protein